MQGLHVAAIALVVALARPVAAEGIPARVEVAFTPGDDIAGLISARIGQARHDVKMQAYLLTDRRIARALLSARRRGVEVDVIGDAAQYAAGGLPWLAALHRAGARIYLNGTQAASHNKIVLLDGGLPGATVITGSYNFTAAAQSKNAENIVVITGNAAIARRFGDNFEFHRNQSRPWQ